jgi:hypothetical protein
VNEGEEAEGDEQAKLLLSGTTFASQLKLSANGAATLSQVDITNAIGKVDFRVVSDLGDVSLAGGAKNLTFADVSGDSRLTIGAPDSSQSVSIKLGRVADLIIESSQAIKSLQAIDWRDTTGANDTIAAPSLSSLKIQGSKTVRGDFEADLETFTSARLGSITVAGLISNATIKAHGDIGAITAGGMVDSNVFAGTDERPDSLTDFDTIQTIQSVTIKGVSGVANAFVDSQVAAAVISKIVVRDVDGTSGDSDFGFVADKVANYTRIGEPRLKNLTEAGIEDELGKYKLLIL